jgi:hypothetical protein
VGSSTDRSAGAHHGTHQARQHPPSTGKPCGDRKPLRKPRAYSDLRINEQLSYFTVSKENFALIRVSRSALAVPQQRERYETKWVRLVTLQSAFDTAAFLERKLEIMKEVELTEMEEMREFLRQMRRASHILRSGTNNPIPRIPVRLPS